MTLLEVKLNLEYMYGTVWRRTHTFHFLMPPKTTRSRCNLDVSESRIAVGRKWLRTHTLSATHHPGDDFTADTFVAEMQSRGYVLTPIAQQHEIQGTMDNWYSQEDLAEQRKAEGFLREHQEQEATRDKIAALEAELAQLKARL